jgi:hypothetical protein
MDFVLQFTPVIYFNFSKEEFETIFDAARHHYDYEIQVSTEERGWLYEMRYKFKDCNTAELAFNTWQIQLMSKTLEVCRIEKARDISNQFIIALRTALDYKKRINDELLSKPLVKYQPL